MARIRGGVFGVCAPGTPLLNVTFGRQGWQQYILKPCCRLRAAWIHRVGPPVDGGGEDVYRRRQQHFLSLTLIGLWSDCSWCPYKPVSAWRPCENSCRTNHLPTFYLLTDPTGWRKALNAFSILRRSWLRLGSGNRELTPANITFQQHFSNLMGHYVPSGGIGFRDIQCKIVCKSISSH